MQVHGLVPRGDPISCGRLRVDGARREGVGLRATLRSAGPRLRRREGPAVRRVVRRDAGADGVAPRGCKLSEVAVSGSLRRPLRTVRYMVTRRVSGGRAPPAASVEPPRLSGVRIGGCAQGAVGPTVRWRRVSSMGAEIRGGGEGFLEDAFDSVGKVTVFGQIFTLFSPKEN